MGELVFEAKHLTHNERGNLLSLKAASVAGKAAWLRLFCLGTLLGVRAKPQTVRRFWTEQLISLWPVLIPADLASVAGPDYARGLDAVFVDAIHQQFHDLNASGEDAEMWRRVFYDFRKLHHFVYHNDLPETVLELAIQPSLQPTALLNFLKSGLPPDGAGRWVGAIGQSMTAPLFFILRELRRLEIIDRRFDSACFYMNGPARRVAAQLGWIQSKETTWFDFETLSNQSERCFEKIRELRPEWRPFYDLPFQWYASENLR